MLQLLIYFFVGIGLSMDTFSLSVSIGTTKPSIKNIIITSLLVGIFHFFMPVLGSLIGSSLTTNLLKTNIITSIIFFILAIEMFLTRNSEEKVTVLNFLTRILFAFSVSIDSFSVGIAFGITKENIIISSTIFFLLSTTFTVLGLLLGKYLAEKNSKLSLYIGISILTIIGFKYLFFS